MDKKESPGHRKSAIPLPLPPKRLNLFERYLSLWVGFCMVTGILIGRALPHAIDIVRSLEFGKGSQINIPIAVLIWLMIFPMMLNCNNVTERKSVDIEGVMVDRVCKEYVGPPSSKVDELR